MTDVGDYLCHGVRFRVTGKHPAELHDEALKYARQFFQVENDRLRVSEYVAEPMFYLVSGAPAYFEADIFVTLVAKP